MVHQKWFTCWQNMKKSVISELKINSWYLQSSGLKEQSIIYLSHRTLTQQSCKTVCWLFLVQLIVIRFLLYYWWRFDWVFKLRIYLPTSRMYLNSSRLKPSGVEVMPVTCLGRKCDLAYWTCLGMFVYVIFKAVSFYQLAILTFVWYHSGLKSNKSCFVFICSSILVHVVLISYQVLETWLLGMIVPSLTTNRWATTALVPMLLIRLTTIASKASVTKNSFLQNYPHKAYHILWEFLSAMEL